MENLFMLKLGRIFVFLVRVPNAVMNIKTIFTEIDVTRYSINVLHEKENGAQEKRKNGSENKFVLFKSILGDCIIVWC